MRRNKGPGGTRKTPNATGGERRVFDEEGILASTNKSIILHILPSSTPLTLYAPSCYRRHFRCAHFVANLADPVAEIACEVTEDPSQLLKPQSPYPPESMGPLPASSARLALRHTSHVPSARLSQVQRHFSTTHSSRQEIQDAYILSAARTPTGKVRRFQIHVFFMY